MTLLVLSDAPVDPLKQQRVSGSGLKLMDTHVSGRPWIYSDDAAESSVLIRTKHLAVAVFGPSSLTRESLGQMVRHVSCVEHLDEIAHRLHGPVFLVAADASGGLRVQGSATGTRAATWAKLGNSTIISDEQHILRVLADSRINMQELALRISDAELTHPFSEGILWRGVHAVPPGSWLGVDKGRRVRLHRWWKAPDPDVPARALAPVLKAGLRASILEAISPDTHLSCDLSGGIDSTTLAYVGRELHPGLTTIFLQSVDAANEDRVWSQNAARDLESQHQVLHHTITHDSPSEEIDWVERLPEGPTEAARYLPIVSALEHHFSGAGRVLHLNGHGGDELFGAVAAMTWSLVRRHRATSLKKVLMHAQTNKRNPFEALRQTMRTGSPQADLRRWAAGDFSTPRNERTAGSRWIPSPVLPMCATKQARQLLKNLLLGHSEHDDLALHPDRTSHQVQESVRFHGALVRRMNLMSTRGSAIEFMAPYLDERIVRTALRLDVKDRFSHSYVKPLLALGRPSRMPLDVFRRRDKGEYSAEIFSKFRASQERIRRLFRGGSALEDYGLIDPGEFQRMASTYSPDGELHDQVLRLERTELWLRSFSSEGHSL